VIICASSPFLHLFKLDELAFMHPSGVKLNSQILVTIDIIFCVYLFCRQFAVFICFTDKGGHAEQVSDV